MFVSPAKELRLNEAFAGQSVALKFGIEPAFEKTGEHIEPCLGHSRITGGESPVHGTIRATGKRDQAASALLQLCESDVRRAVFPVIEKSLARKPHEIGIAARVLCEQNDRPVMGGGAGTRPGGFLGSSRKCDIQRTADNRLKAFPRERLGEFERAEEIVAVGDRQCGLDVRRCKLGKCLHRQRAFQQRVGGMDVKVNKAGRGHRFPCAIRQAPG